MKAMHLIKSLKILKPSKIMNKKFSKNKINKSLNTKIKILKK